MVTDAADSKDRRGTDGASAAAGWHPDPSGRHQFRYWDGTRWTDDVSSRGLDGRDPLPTGSVVPARCAASSTVGLEVGSTTVGRHERKTGDQIRRSGVVGHTGSAERSLLDEPVLAINQRAKLLERRVEFTIRDQRGRVAGTVRGRLISSRVEVLDAHGRRLLELRRENSLLTSRISVSGPDGGRVGRILPSRSMKEVDRAFKLEGRGSDPIGSVYSEDRHQPAKRRRRVFNVQDSEGSVVARITKTHAGLAKETLTKADEYVLGFETAATDTLRYLCVAVVLHIDAVHHQK